MTTRAEKEQEEQTEGTKEVSFSVLIYHIFTYTLFYICNDKCCCVCGVLVHLDEELLVAGPPLPSKLASPGPARAPRPP